LKTSYQDTQDLDKIQAEAAIIVTGATKLVSLNLFLHNDADLLRPSTRTKTET